MSARDQVGRRIAAATGKTYEWEFTLIGDDRTVNAFCLPGGKVAVFSGILPFCRNDQGLAVVCKSGVSRRQQLATARLAVDGLRR